MKIVVLAGGLSPEREVSLSSGSLIANALSDAGHEVVLLDVYEGVTLGEGGVSALFADKKKYEYKLSGKEPNLDEIRAKNGNRKALIGKNVLEVCAAADVAFLALHGDMGENGQLQATLDIYGIPYTGTGYVGSMLAMDKDIAKKIVASAGVASPEGIYFDTLSDSPDAIIDKIGLPCVVKPNACGSSVGVSIVESEDALKSALAFAAKYERRVLVERKITGREFSIGILEGRVLPPIEIIPLEGFYDYKNKYESGKTREVCPAEITGAQLAEISRLALAAASALRLGSYARIDFLLEESSGKFYFLEANTLPGMTPVSLLPQEAAAVGIEYKQLCCMIADSARKVTR